ncbi:HNH endonuclease signature motif containing protein [Corynebacterium epidermidicanis]|uniref:HNH nuclease domain-containing protein n=1 Tax=Corynebacterium epidermidicanis TaxID=1050174 RepID=A0A0G3GTN5_9CORY|nr:HNH endonuclease signature motif containing protein [Corynebacterium epidermidicanis]AKK02918.1 protein of unknown function DUF222/HNH endonuclease [Corynebacterium epidermidicanis]
MIRQAKQALRQALIDGPCFDDFADLVEIKELIGRLETEMARDRERFELEESGASAGTARKIIRRTNNRWDEGVLVEQQDAILAALEKLSSSSPRREEIYAEAATAALESSVKQTHEFAKKLVREENERLAKDPFEAERQRRFQLRSQDEHGGCAFSGYAPAATAALLKSLMDRAFRSDNEEVGENRTIAQRNFDAFALMLEWASSQRISRTGHASLVISVTEHDKFNWRGKFSTNVGIDLNLYDLAKLSGDSIIDYIVVHDHNGAVKELSTAERSANFLQRIALMARDLVCQHPGCSEPASRCDAHHVVPWSRGGPTSIGNLSLLCPKHHRRNDDSFVEQHVELFNGIPYWLNKHLLPKRNNSPAAKRAGGRRVNGET